MEKLKEKNKHDHLFTKILKVSIFALVMLAPMFAVAAKCMYVSFNKNAKDSYYAETAQPIYYDTNEVNNIDDLVVGNIYTFTYNLEQQTSSQYILMDKFFIIDGSYTSEWYSSTTSRQQPFLELNVNTYVYVYSDNKASYWNRITIDFVLKQLDNYTEIQYISPCERQYIKEYVNIVGDLSDVFYHSIEQIGNKQIFSWTKNTGIYGAINTMTTGLGIDPTNNILAVLLTYWSLITAVYIIIDIVIEMFVRLTHLLA